MSFLFVAGTALPAAAQGTIVEQKSKYKYAIDSDIKMNVGTDKVNVGAKTEIHYENTKKATETAVTIHSMAVVSLVNGIENMNIRMAKKGMSLTQQGQKREIPYDKAPKPQQEMLDTFGSPIMKVTLDANGKETKRELVNKSQAAKNLQKDGMLKNARLFHPEFSSKKEWTSKREIAMGNGNVITGDLKYVKSDKAAANGNTVVNVSGTMTKKSMASGGITMENIKYVVTGKEEYDPKKKIWVSGALNIVVSWDVKTPGGNGKASGTMKVTLTTEK